MIPYINIHTHHLSQDNGVLLFNNRFGSGEALYTGSYFSVGIHPWDAGIEFSVEKLEQLLLNENCLAIGECGLDKLKGPELTTQKIVFEAQLQLAIIYQKPVIIHCVKAFDELIEICQPYLGEIPLIIHGFNKSVQLGEQLIHKGFHISLNPSLFKKNTGDFKKIPLNTIFLETDHNEALSIAGVYKRAAHYFNVSEDELKEKIYSNFTTLFNIHGR